MYFNKGAVIFSTFLILNLGHSINKTKNSVIKSISHEVSSKLSNTLSSRTLNNSATDFETFKYNRVIKNNKSEYFINKKNVCKQKERKRPIQSKAVTTHTEVKKAIITKNVESEKDDLSYSRTSKSANDIKHNKNNKKRNNKIEYETASISDNENESANSGFESDEIRLHLKDGEEFLDFSALAKMKEFSINNDSAHFSHREKYANSMENPFLNLNCSSLSLAEEQNISTGYLDERITTFIKKAYDYPDGGSQLLEDMQKYYCYLKHVNTLVVNKVKRGKVLMNQLVDEDPAFTQVRFDTDELKDCFTWVEEEKEAFEKIMDAMCYQWKCLVARHSH